MNAQREPENRLVCPNCQALNQPFAQICVGCGVDMDAFRASMPRLQRLKQEEAASHRAQLKGQVGSWLQEENKISSAAFKRLMLGLLVVAAVLAVLVSLVSFLYASRYRLSQDEIRVKFEASLLCLQQKNFVCAHEGFQGLKFSGYEGLDEYLNQAQLGMARQFMESGQPEQAVTELRELLQRAPGNLEAVELLKLAYERWITQLDVEGSWFKKWFVTRERDARFPVPTSAAYPNGAYP